MNSSSTTVNKFKRKKFRLRGASLVAAYFLGIAIVIYLIWNVGICGWVASRQYSIPTPGKVNLVYLDPKSGFKIFLKDREVQLIRTGNVGFNASDSNLGIGSEGNDGDSKLYLPMMDILEALRGNQAGLTSFVMQLNKLGPNENWPIQHIVWKASDIQKAVNGDPALLKKLEIQINMKMDGEPMPFLNTVALENGIIVETPCPVHIKFGGVEKTMIANIQRPFKPKFLIDVLKDYSDHGDPTKDERAIYYAKWLENYRIGKGPKENVGKELLALASPQSVTEYGQYAESVLDYIHIILSDKNIEGATDVAQDVNGDTLYTLNLNLTNEGRMRLWKFSILHPGGTLLVVMDGNTIAAPKVDHQLMSRQVSVSQMLDQQVVDDAVQEINAAEKNVKNESLSKS